MACRKDAWKRFSDDGYNHYDVVEIGFKYNMMDLQAAIGMHQITRVEAYWERRLRIWQQYDRAFGNLPVSRPAPLDPESRHGLHLYTLLIDEHAAPVSRDKFMAELHRRKIGAGVHYRAIPVHPVYQRLFGWIPSDYPVADRIGRMTVSLPLSAKLTDEDVNDVIGAVREVLEA
jgi:dTDP-4-amino-4,6-dideoxygalactose transaminase